MNCRGTSDVRAVVYSRSKVSSSRDFRFGADFKNQTILQSLFTTKGNLCIYLISPHGILTATVLQKVKLGFVATGLFRGRREYNQLHSERPATCPAGNQRRRWCGSLKGRASVGPAQCTSYVRKASDTQLTAWHEGKALEGTDMDLPVLNAAEIPHPKDMPCVQSASPIPTAK